MTLARYAAVTCGVVTAVACGSPTSPAEPADAAGPPLASAEGNDTIPDAGAVAVDTSVPGSARLLAEAKRILGAAKHSAYTHTTTVDEATGTYDFDCSGFVDYAMSRVTPEAFAALRAATASRPVAASYVQYATKATSAWTPVARAADLAAGDLVAWLEPPGSTSTNTGHVMVVSGAVGAFGDALAVPVIDSTEIPHGPTDSRYAARATGIGTGTVALVVDPAGKPVSYRWSTAAGSKTETTTIALARLR